MSSAVKVTLKFDVENMTGMSIHFIPTKKRSLTKLISGSEISQSDVDTANYKIVDFTTITSNIPAVHTAKSRQIKTYFESSVFIDPDIKRNVNQIETRYLNKVEQSEKNRQDLMKRIGNIYDTDPTWSFLPHEDFEPTEPSRFTIFEGGQRLFLDDFGDGLHYGLAVLVIAKTCKNAALFIEEIESHQHPEAIKNLITNLLDIARTNNVQLFITTHNQDVWRYLHYNYDNPEERKKEFQCFRVTRDKDTGIVETIIEEGLANIQPELHGEL